MHEIKIKLERHREKASRMSSFFKTIDIIIKSTPKNIATREMFKYKCTLIKYTSSAELIYSI